MNRFGPAGTHWRHLTNTAAGKKVDGGQGIGFRMSTSFVEYRGKGFWSWDGYLEHVLALLVERIPTESAAPWLAEARRHWQEQSSGAFTGWIHPKLDEFASTEDRRQIVLQMVDGATHGAKVTPEATATLQLLASLLRGELNTDASSPLEYMISGEFPYEWPRKE